MLVTIIIIAAGAFATYTAAQSRRSGGGITPRSGEGRSSAPLSGSTEPRDF